MQYPPLKFLFPTKPFSMKKVFTIITFLLLSLTGISQNIGIGTADPVAKLDVLGGVNITDSLFIGGKLRITGSTPGPGKVLTSDSIGLASWAAPAVTGRHFEGESFGGGIVFYVYDNGLHGLIAATASQSNVINWNSGVGQYSTTGATKDGLGAGFDNTEIIINRQGAGDYAAQLCANYQGGNYGDWYLPSKFELHQLILKKDLVGLYGGELWSSTEYNDHFAWMENSGSYFQYANGKGNKVAVWAIRAF
jgi:hypothetical protein